MTEPAGNVSAKIVKLQTPKKSEVTETLKDVVASAFASFANIYVGQPFDTVKVKLQTASSNEFGGAVDCLRKTWQTEGFTKLWAGSVPAFTGAVLENAASFGINGALKRADLFGTYTTTVNINNDGGLVSKRHVDSNNSLLAGTPEFLQPFVTGSITGFLTAFVLCPCDVIKCRAQIAISRGLNTSTLDVLGRTLATTGVRGLFVGMGAQVIRDVPFYATFFGSYDTICALIKANTTWSDPIVYASAGGLAGQLAWLSSIVPDAVKSTIQTSDTPQKFMPTLRHIVATRGVYRGLFAGVEVAIFRAYPANAALFVGYEYAKKTLDKVV